MDKQLIERKPASPEPLSTPPTTTPNRTPRPWVTPEFERIPLNEALAGGTQAMDSSAVKSLS